MKLSNSMNTILILAGALMVLAGCSHGPTVQDFPPTSNARDEVIKLNDDMKTAVHEQVNVLSPRSFKEADESMQDARKSLDRQQDSKETLHYVAQARAYLERANRFTKLSHENIEDVIAARRAALDAGADKNLRQEFQAADESLTDATADIEKNDLKSANQNRSTLQQTYLNLELMAIKKSALEKSRDTIAQAEKDGAKKVAPQTLAIAEKSVQDTDAYITANRHDTAGIGMKAAKTSAAAEHLRKITGDSKSAGKTSAEDMALRVESEQTKVTDKQGELNASEDSLELQKAQTARGEAANQELAATNLDQQSELNAGASANQALTAQNKNLSSDRALNERYEEARSQFTKSEAEVYKQGNTLMIRLRGLAFPVAKSELKDANFPLLTKVQSVIRKFGKTSVTVEGHTDSNGNPASNERLSQDRAEAVKKYLASNTGSLVTGIDAVGYGDQKPLASNKTATGRAQNRRVDIVIHPEVNPSSTN